MAREPGRRNKTPSSPIYLAKIALSRRPQGSSDTEVPGPQADLPRAFVSTRCGAWTEKSPKFHSINRTGDRTMIINTKIALAAAFFLGAASAALANENVLALNTCPTLEGYPDCHPDGRESWTTYSTGGESMSQKKSPTNGMRRERKLEGGGAIPAPQ